MVDIAENRSVNEIVVNGVDIIIQLNEITGNQYFRLIWANKFFQNEYKQIVASNYYDSGKYKIWNPLNGIESKEVIKFITQKKQNYTNVYKYSYKDKNGWYYVNIAPFKYDKHGELNQVVCAIIDLTDNVFNPGRYAEMKKEIGILKNKVQLSQLSRTEIELLKHIGNGKSEKEIAEIQSRSIHTVKTHLKNIHKKLYINKNTELVKFAIETGIA